MDFKNRQSSPDVRLIHHNLPVKAPRAEQCRIKDIRPIRSRDNDDAFIGGKPIHLDQKLVECLLPLVMTATDPRAALTTDSIDLVNKYNAGGVLFRLIEKVAHPRRADAYEHFHEIGAADGEKWHSRLPRHGTR